ncbi:MAG: hypothetical protein EOO88_27405 [Pedobacter sp.]|nr:MAG: hypothetical protein EOO88_27405 [Pedobacter sp.]
MKYTFTILFLIITNLVFSQTKGIKVLDLKPLHEDNKFPKITSLGNEKIAEKVNTYLQLTYLEHIPGVFKKHPFEKVAYNGTSTNHASFLEWKRMPTRPHILSLSISAEYTGAYSEESTSYENFDLQTGDKILIKNLFTKPGLVALEQSLNKRIRAEIKDYTNSIESSLKKDSGNVREDREMLAMYNECLESVVDNQMEYYSFYLRKDSITFVRGRCSNHAMRALDDLDTFYESYSFAQIEKYLSPLGRNILKGNVAEKLADTPDGKIFKGKIDDKYAITLLIDKIYADGSVSIKYWYDKYKNPIAWNGTYKNGHFTLTEEDLNDNNAEAVPVKANISADWIERKSIIGRWTNIHTGKISSIKLQLY